MIHPPIREQLTMLAEEEYRRFSSSLLPNIPNVLGVRLPQLRKIALAIARDNWRAYLAEAENGYFEEKMLQAMVIGYAAMKPDEKLRHAAAFVPKIDNWSVCDRFCLGLKFTVQHRETVWTFLQPYLASRQTYEIRFGVVMLLNFFVTEAYIGRVLDILDRTHREDYYVRMAVAWALSFCYIKLPEPTLAYLKNNTLDTFTYHKTLQKIVESYRPSAEEKAMIRGMRKNRNNQKSRGI